MIRRREDLDEENPENEEVFIIDESPEKNPASRVQREPFPSKLEIIGHLSESSSEEEKAEAEVTTSEKEAKIHLALESDQKN